MKELKTLNMKELNRYFFDYIGRMPTTKEINHMKKHNEARVLYTPTVNVEQAKKTRKNLKEWGIPQTFASNKAEQRALNVIAYHRDAVNGQKMPISDEMRAVLNKHLTKYTKPLLAQI